MNERTHVLIPVKQLSAAKVRLGEQLSREERRALVLAMLGDVLATVRTAGLEASVLSPDPEVLSFASEREVWALPEWPGAASLNQAIEYALESTLAKSDSLIFLLADTPLVTADELQALMVAGMARAAEPRAGDRGVALATDAAGKGTSALFVHPPEAIPTRFGLNSAALHAAEARARGIPYDILRLPGLGLDVDTAADLQALAAAPPRTRTQELLVELGIPERLAIASA